jgi:hypothetical protein
MLPFLTARQLPRVQGWNRNKNTAVKLDLFCTLRCVMEVIRTPNECQ